MYTEQLVEILKDIVSDLERVCFPYLVKYEIHQEEHRYVFAVGHYELYIDVNPDGTFRFEYYDLQSEELSREPLTLNHIDELVELVRELVRQIEPNEKTSGLSRHNIMVDLGILNTLINDEQLSGYAIEKDTGISRQLISNLRTGKHSIENLSILNAYTLQNYYQEVLKTNN